MTITNKLKERFCKDCKIPIKVFDEPYFYQRLDILDSQYNSREKWEKFLKCLEKYDSEQDYFEDYNKVKQSMIDYIKASEGYNKLNSDNMNTYCNTLKEINLPKGVSSDIYKPSNVGKKFISLDIKKANFTALKHYGGIFDNFNTYEDFVSNFTDNPHFVESKYIREVIFGNCNPKKQITYERYLVNEFLSFLLDSYQLFSLEPNTFLNNLCFISNDEIIFSFESDAEEIFKIIKNIAEEFKKREGVEFKPELFVLSKVSGDVECYVKNISAPENKLEFKCCNSNDIHCIIKIHEHKEITEDDLVFVHDGKSARYLSSPEICLEM